MLHNLHNASKSKIRNPKSKIQNPKSKIQTQIPKFEHKEMLHNNPKSKIENPQNPAEKVWILDSIFGFWIPDFGFCPPLGNNSGDSASRSEARI